MGKEPRTQLSWDEPRTMVWPLCGADHPGHHGGAQDTCVDHKGARATSGGAHDTRGNHEGARNAHVRHTQRWIIWAQRTWQQGEAGGGPPEQHVEGWSNWGDCPCKATATQRNVRRGGMPRPWGGAGQGGGGVGLFAAAWHRWGQHRRQGSLSICLAVRQVLGIEFSAGVLATAVHNR